MIDYFFGRVLVAETYNIFVTKRRTGRVWTILNKQSMQLQMYNVTMCREKRIKHIVRTPCGDTFSGTRQL